MKFYVIEKNYELAEMLELYGYATSYDVVRWFKQSPYKDSLTIIEYDCSETEFIAMFDEICSHDVDTYKLEMKQSLDGKMSAPLYVNQESYYIDDYYIPQDMDNLQAALEKLIFIIHCMDQSLQDNMKPIISLLSEYLQRYNYDNSIGDTIMDRDSLIIRTIYEEDGNYYGDY